MSGRLKLAFVLPHFRSGGAERAVLNWCRSLDRTRFSPCLMLKHKTGEFLELLPKDVPVYALGGKRTWRLSGQITRLLDEHSIDVAYSATNAMNLALAASWPANCVKVLSEHTSPAAYLREAKWRNLRSVAMRTLYLRADAILVPSRGIADELSRLIPKATTAQIVPNPIVETTTGPAKARIRPYSATNTLRIVAAGRLVSAKAFNRLIAACGLLRDRCVDFVCEIFGSGELECELRSQIDRAGLSDNVRLRGYTADLGKEISTSDLFVSSSRREGFGNVIVEALAVGIPVIATACPGPTEILRNSKAGILVEPENEHTLADAIEKLWRADSRRQEMSEQGPSVAAQYRVENSVQNLMNSIEKTCLIQSST